MKICHVCVANESVNLDERQKEGYTVHISLSQQNTEKNNTYFQG